ncbi:MAG: GldL-related protein [Sediminibacterium sp.]
MKKKKLDIFNLFYSGAAVVILIGVIAKLLEWPAQDLLITLGLSIEAVVFGVSAIKYVEVEEKNEVATEATLAKVADGLGTLASKAAPLGGNGGGDTFVNIQTGTAEADLPSAPSSKNTLKVASTSYPETNTKVEIDIQTPTTPVYTAPVVEEAPKLTQVYTPTANPTGTVNATNALWQLEQLDILSLSRDLFYQPEWIKLSSEEYNHITNLFKQLFNKKVPTKESLPFLAQFPVKIPIPEITELELSAAAKLEVHDVEVLCKAFEVIKVNNLFEHFIIEVVDADIVIRARQAKETIIFGGEDEALLAHCQVFYKNTLIISPNIDCLKPIIKLKDQFLVDHLIQKVNIQNDAELISLSDALVPKQDETKKKLFNKFKKVKYNTQNDAGYVYVKTLTKLAATFADQSMAQDLLNAIIEIQVNESLVITNADVVNSYADTIYFGPKNEYSVVLRDIFVNGELNNLDYFNSLIEKLASDNVANKTKLVELFGLKEHDSKKEIFNKLNYHLAKTNTVAGGAQLAFILLYKQYS